MIIKTIYKPGHVDLAPNPPSWPNSLSDVPLTRGQAVVVRKTTVKAEVKYLWPMTEFPRSKTDQKRAQNEYRTQYIRRFLNDGMIRDDERGELKVIASELDIGDSDVASIEAQVLSRWRAGLASCSKDRVQLEHVDREALSAWLAGNESPPCEQVVLAAGWLADLLEPSIMRLVRNEGAATVRGVQAVIGLDAPTTLTLMERLESRLILKRLGSAKKDPSNNAVFQVVDASSTQRMELVLKLAEESIQSGTHVPHWAFELLDLANKLLVESGQGDKSEKIRPLMARAASLEVDEVNVVNEEQTPGDTAGESLTIEGRSFSAARLPALIRNLAEFLRASGREVVIPFKVGRTRYLVNDQPLHENGAKMPYPIEATIGGRQVYFETNWQRSVGIFHVKRFLNACGISVDEGTDEQHPLVDEVEVSTLSDAECEEAASSGPDEVISGRGLRFSLDGEEFTVAGNKVKEFLSKVLQILVEKESINDDLLPIECGRFRYLLANAPIHRDDSPFERPVKVDDYYIETSHGFTSAIEYAAVMLDKFGAVNIEHLDLRTQLAVRLVDGTLIEGRNTREFITNALAVLDERMFLEEDKLALPYRPQGTTRVFLSEETTFTSKGGVEKSMISPQEFSNGSRSFFAEVYGGPHFSDHGLR